jgi:hypothetical protein
MTIPRAGRRRASFFLFLNIVSIVIVLFVFTYLWRRDHDPRVATSITGLIGAVLALANFVVARQQTSAQRTRDASPDQVDAAVKWVRQDVSIRLTEDAEVWALDAPAPIEVPWAVVTTGIAPRIGAAKVRVNTGTGVESLYEWVKESDCRQGMVIGEPGSGKTTTTVLLTRCILSDDKYMGSAPVILPMSSWSPRDQSLDAWLVQRLTMDFPRLLDGDEFGQNVAAALVKTGRVIPILDGLDEMVSSDRESALARLRARSANSPLVVTCRLRDYEHLANRGRTIPTMAVVRLDPLPADQVVHFLELAGATDQARADLVSDLLK